MDASSDSSLQLMCMFQSAKDLASLFQAIVPELKKERIMLRASVEKGLSVFFDSPHQQSMFNVPRELFASFFVAPPPESESRGADHTVEFSVDFTDLVDALTMVGPDRLASTLVTLKFPVHDERLLVDLNCGEAVVESWVSTGAEPIEGPTHATMFASDAEVASAVFSTPALRDLVADLASGTDMASIHLSFRSSGFEMSGMGHLASYLVEVPSTAQKILASLEVADHIDGAVRFAYPCKALIQMLRCTSTSKHSKLSVNERGMLRISHRVPVHSVLVPLVFYCDPLVDDEDQDGDEAHGAAGADGGGGGREGDVDRRNLAHGRVKEEEEEEAPGVTGSGGGGGGGGGGGFGLADDKSWFDQEGEGRGFSSSGADADADAVFGRDEAVG